MVFSTRVEPSRLLSLLLLGTLLLQSHCLYASGSPAGTITNRQLHEHIASPSPLLIHFYAATGSKACQKLVPEFEKAARALKGVVPSASLEGKVREPKAVEKFPTVSLFIDGKERQFEGNYDSESIVSWVLESLKAAVKERARGTA